MKKSNKILPEAIKEVVDQFGKDIVKDSRLVNILNDIITYSEAPACKAILKEITKSDYCNKLLAIDPQQADWQLIINGLVAEVSTKQGYRADIVDYIFSSIIYALGHITKCPVYVQEDPIDNIDKVRNSLSDLKGELIIQKRMYIQLLENLITIPDNYSGYYTTSALSELYLVEGKIHLLNKALNYNDDDWCKQEKQKVLQKYNKDISSARKTVYTITAIVASIAVAIGAYLFYFFYTFEDRKAFNQLWRDSEALYQEGNYNELISYYQLAFEKYSSFSSQVKKDEAISKLYSICEKVISDGRSSNIGFDRAVKIVNSAVNLPLGKEYQEWIRKQSENAEEELKGRIARQRDRLIENISNNKGKLDADGVILLNELCSLYPNDYWFNFIKNKNNE